jgi:capsule polysaccharide export protein KpsE/RkpR
MYRFQKKYGVYAIPEQLVSAFQAAGDLESELFKQEIAAEYARNQFGENSNQYKTLSSQIDFIKGKISELKNSNTLSYPTNVLIPFEKLPKMIEQYFRYYREIEIQTKIMEFILPMYEQAKIEQQKSIPTLLVIDKAVPPQLKYAPKKALIILGISLLFLFLMILFVYRGETVINETEYRNALAEKENRFYERIIKIYKTKF